MGLLELFTVAVGLSADAFTAAVCKGMGLKRMSARYALVVAAFFGSFQAIMPLCGSVFAAAIHEVCAPLCGWIAFALLTVAGIKMTADGLSQKNEVVISPAPDIAELTALAVATSIDAFAVGVSFTLIGVNIVPAAVIIGTVTFALSLLGVLMGRYVGAKTDARLSAAGGVVILVLAVRVLMTEILPKY